MAIFYFSDVLGKVGLDPSKVKLIRRVLTSRGFRECYRANVVYEYTCHQKSGFSRGYDYRVTFISDQGTPCRLDPRYKVGAAVPDVPDTIPKGIPEIEARKFQGKNAYFHLESLDLLKEYEGRPIIDWGRSVCMWHQRGTTEKPVMVIQADKKKVFSGFENLILTYDELKEIVGNPAVYEA